VIVGCLLVVTVILLIMFIMYRLRKKDEGSYALDDPTLLIAGSEQRRSASKALIADQEFYA